VTHSTTTDYAFDLLNQISERTKKEKLSVHVYLDNGGLVFLMRKPPFYLKNYLTFERLRLAKFDVVESILKNMERELELAAQDAADGANL